MEKHWPLFLKQKNFYYSEATKSYEFRKQQLILLKKMLKENQSLIFEALKADLNKSRIETYFSEYNFIENEIHDALKNLKKWMKIKKVSTPLTLFPAKSEVHCSPRGQVLVLSPWNYPLHLALAPAVGALAAGNTVILKPSELSPNTSDVIQNLVRQYLSSEVFEVLTGDTLLSQELLELPFDFIFFTGSTAVGKKIMAAASKHLTPLCLELGGKSPCIVDESIDLNFAARKIVWGKFFNAGQTCVAPDYLCVHEKIHDELLSLIKKQVDTFFENDPQNSSDFGRIINKSHWKRLSALLDDKKIFLGGQINEETLFISPTVMTGIDWSHPSMAEEIFGPILPVLKYSNLESLISKIKSLPKPLAFYFFSNDQKSIKEVLSRVSFGGACINDCLIHLANPNLPFGGVGESGFGAYHGRYSFELFSHKKAIVMNRSFLDFGFKYPPYKLMKFFKYFREKFIPSAKKIATN